MAKRLKPGRKPSNKDKLKKNNSIVKTRLELNKAIIDIYKKGGTTKDVVEYLKSVDRESTARIDIYNANLQIKEESRLERESLIMSHVRRYEKIFKDNYEKTLNNFSHLPPHLRRFSLADCYSVALDALVAKEKVLGLHSKQFRFQLNNFFKKKIVAQYSFTSFDFAELVDLLYLINKMRVREDMPVYDPHDDLIEDINNIKKETIDVSHVELNTDNANKIKEEVTLRGDVAQVTGDIVQVISEKIIKQDLKNNDPKRKNFLDKLKDI